MKRLAMAGLVLLAMHLAASAQDGPDTASSAAPSNSNGSGKMVPKVVVRWDCGQCEQNEKVAPLIETSYETEARAHGFSVSSTEVAELVITDYRQRHPANRVMFGVFAGKDRLATRLKFRDQEYVAKDYSANAFQGMNTLCDSVARQALTQITSALKP